MWFLVGDLATHNPRYETEEEPPVPPEVFLLLPPLFVAMIGSEKQRIEYR